MLHSNEIENIQGVDDETNDESFDVEKERETKVKVSTGCGPSPDREIEEIFANDYTEHSRKSFTPIRDIPSRSSKVSIGTSPPPQTISTQVLLKSDNILKVSSFLGET